MIKIIKDFLYVSYKDKNFNFDECRIYDEFYIEFYYQNNFMTSIECKEIEIQKVKDMHYYIKLKYNDNHYMDDCIYLKLEEKLLDNIICNIGDIVIRRNYNTLQNIKLFIGEYNDKLSPDSNILFYLGIGKDSIFNKLTDKEIIEQIGWKITEIINDKLKNKHKDKECIELIKNLDTLGNIKNAIQEFKNLKK